MIDKLKQKLFELVYKSFNIINVPTEDKRYYETYKLKGIFDGLDIRKSAYE